MATSVPYRCPVCMTDPEACGFNGILVWPHDARPYCEHNKGKGKPCHEDRVKMVPSKGA